MVNGVQCVMMDGILMMLVWCVDNWDLDHMHFPIEMPILVKEQDQFGWIMFYVKALNQH